MDNRIRDQINKLVRLAKRPGTQAEGIAAREMAVRLSIKYRIPCEFVVIKPESDDAIFFHWIKALNAFGWTVSDCKDTKIGRQIQFKKVGIISEIQITQRKNGPDDFEAEYIGNPNQNWVSTGFMSIHLNELIAYLTPKRSRYH